MARHIQARDISPVLTAARTWINDCLVGDGSVFSANALWQREPVDEATRAFVDHPDEGDDAFLVKLSRQVTDCTPASKQLLAEMLWAIFLFPSNMRATTKREQVVQVWSWSGGALDPRHPLLADAILGGVGSGGQAYHTLRYRELAFVLAIVKAIKLLDPAERVTLFTDYDAFASWIETVPREGNRQFRHMLRYFAFPDRVERMSSTDDRRQVLVGFGAVSPPASRRMTDAQMDTALLELRKRLEQAHPGTVLDFYEAPLESRWRTAPDGEEGGTTEGEEGGAEGGDETSVTRPRALLPSDALKPVNRILYGPPGTGKTHWMRRKCDEYTDQPNSVDYDTWLQEILTGVGWRPLIAAVLAQSGGTARVATIREHRWVVAKLRQRGRTASALKNTLWAFLQTHTSPDAPNVAYRERRPPFIFTKAPNADWKLVADWRQLDEEADSAERVLAAGPSGSTAPTRRFRIVTFHPSFTYEEFIRGIRPVQHEDDGTTQFQVVDGVFKRACDEARANPSKRYAFFIDEINRANIAKVFGELITLIEPDKRAVYDSEGRLTSGMEVALPGSDTAESDPRFGVPANLDIYGTMNTADRSIALLDIALRRRFEFEEMAPVYELIPERVPQVNLRALLRRINDRLEYLLDRDHRIGHAYLMSVQHLTDLRRVFRLKIIPLLQEYFFDDLIRVAAVLATNPDAPPLVTKERLEYAALFAGLRPEGTPAEQGRYVVTPDDSWTEATFAGIYENGPRAESEHSSEL